MDSMRKVCLITFTVLLGLLLTFPLCVAQIYKMVDEKGNVYFTDDPGKLSEKYKNVKQPSKNEKQDSKIEKQAGKNEKQDRSEKQDRAVEKKPMTPPGKERVEQEAERETTRPIMEDKRSIQEEKRSIQEEKRPDQEVTVNQPDTVEQDKTQKIEELRDRLSKMQQLQFKTTSQFDILLGLIGLIVMMGGGVWFLVVAFRTSVGWGFACLFVPFAFFVFLVKYWKSAWMPLGVNILGAILVFAVSFKVL